MAAVRSLSVALAGALLSVAQLGAQGSIRGTVVDSANRQPLGNVTVTVEGTPRGAISRLDGSFDIGIVPAGTQRVRARRIGYHTLVQAVNVSTGGAASVQLVLAPQPAVLTEIVATGYGTQRREAITSAVSTVDATQANVGVITSATQLLQGRATGVQIVQSSGEPGANVQIRIRGGTSISASNDPLYVIDGVPLQNDATAPGADGASGGNPALPRNPLNSINPNDIETLTVLKDASATAIYGSRAANGVILITTKRGTREAQIEYDTYIGATSPTKTLGLASGDQYRAFVQANVAGLGAQAVANLGGASTDWEKAITRTGLSMNHDVAFSGGSAQTKYRASLNYFSREGVVISSGLRRYQGRLNATHDALSGRVRLGLNLMASRVANTYSQNENAGGFNGGVFTNMVVYNPTYPIDCTGNVKPCTSASSAFYESGPVGVFNPVGMVSQLQDEAPENRLLGDFSGTISLFADLTAQTTIGADNVSTTRRTYFPRSSPVGDQHGQGHARQVDRNLQNATFNQLLTYSPHLSGNHELEVVGGYEYTKYDNREFGVAAEGFLSDAFATDYLVGGATVPNGYPFSWHSESKLASYFSRVNYGYAGKYFVTGVLRQDGSSRLAEGHKWATFPAISGSWRISEENFMRGSRPIGLSSLALRAGWGVQGNQSISPYQTKLLLRPDPNALYPFGGVITSGLAAVQVGNPDLKWETATQTNVGVDYGFLNDRITGGLEIYQKNTKDLLQTVPVPQPAVVPNQLKNIGTLRNRGLEAFADMRLYNAPGRSLSGGLTLTVERNTVTSLGDSTAACQGDAVTQTFSAYSKAGCLYYLSGWVSGQGQSNQWSQVIMRGQSIGTFLAPQFLDVTGGVQYFACTAANDPNCVNGRTTAPVDADRQFIGSANPSFTLGLRNNATWNDFDASWLWRGEFGGKVFNNTALVYQSKSLAAQGRNLLANAITDPDNLLEPAKFSSRWIEDRTFVRLQNLTVGYTVPRNLLGGHPTRFYVSGDNVLLMAKYSGYDPEVFTASGLASRGIDYLSYPPTRTFTFGARTQF